MSAVSVQNTISSSDSINYSGFIKKKGRGRSFLGRRNWKNRFITINTVTGELKYFSDSDISKHPKGSISLGGCEITAVPGKELSFEVKSKTRDEAIIFGAYDNKQLVSWLGIFRAAVTAAPGMHLIMCL